MIDIIISQDMIPVLVTLFVLALVTLVTIAYVSRERFFIPVFIIIPTIFFCVYISWATISNLLGFPVATAIPDRSIYLAHVTSEEENVLYVWAKSPKDKKPRLYEVPNTKNNKKQMNEAKQRAGEGIPQVLARKPEDRKGNGGRTPGGDYQRYDFNVGHEEFKRGGNYPANDPPMIPNLPNLIEDFNSNNSSNEQSLQLPH